jgi:hypothetical protein
MPKGTADQNFTKVLKTPQSLNSPVYYFFRTLNIPLMSLYHEAAECLTVAQKNGGSLKSVVFGKKTWKTDARTLFAICAEAAKWSTILSEVVEKSGILKLEKNVSTILDIREIG